MLVKSKLSLVALVSAGLAISACGTKSKSSNSKKPDSTEEQAETPEEEAPPATPSKPTKKPAKKPTDEANPADTADTSADQDDTSSDDDTDEPPVDDRPACEIAWDDYQYHNEAGEYVEYEITTVSNFGTPMTMESLSRQEVLESNSDKVAWKNATTMNGNTFESEYEVLKTVFVENCENNEVVIEEEGDETVEVPAGTFDSHWQRIKTETDTSTTVSTSWMHTLPSGEKLMVKSFADTEMSNGTSEVTQHLISTNKQ